MWCDHSFSQRIKTRRKAVKSGGWARGVIQNLKIGENNVEGLAKIGGLGTLCQLRRNRDEGA